jgi:hypothetical protein
VYKAGFNTVGTWSFIIANNLDGLKCSTTLTFTASDQNAVTGAPN